jgi:ribonuclease BN (tRNA processing enzyme)
MFTKSNRMLEDHSHMKNIKKFHTRMKVEMLALILIIPRFIQQARKKYIYDVSRAFPGTRIA